MPKISVIVPVYKAEKYIRRCVDSILAQTFTDFELLLIDDGSPDSSGAICDEYVARDSRVKVFHKENGGVSSARNVGLDNACGEWIHFVDADDLISTSFIQHRVEYMESNPNVDYASFPSKAFTDVNNLPTIDDEGYVYGIDKGQSDFIPEVLRGYSYPFGVWSNIYRKESLLRAQIKWDERLFVYQDFYFLLNTLFAELKHSFGDNKNVDYYYRQLLNENHVCGHFASQQKVDSTNYLFERVILEMKKKGIFEIYRTDFLDFVLLHYERLINDGCSKENLTAYTDLCVKYYGKKHIFSVMKGLIKVQNSRIRRLLFVLFGAICFGVERYKESLITNVLLYRGK